MRWVMRRWRSPTNVRSAASCAHAEAKRLGLPLIVGAEMRLQRAPAGGAAQGGPAAAPGPHLVLLAMSRRGYGNLSQWITVARRRAPKGQYPTRRA